jgi:serpin B
MIKWLRLKIASAILTIASLSLITVLVTATGGCAPETPDVPDAVVLASGKTMQSEKTRIETPEVSGGNQADLTNGNGAFAFDLYQQLKTREGNLFYSPYSISAALAMTYAGTYGTTAEQMAAALHFDLPQEKLHPAFNWLESELAKRGEGAEGKDAEGFRLNVVNAIWAQKGYEFRVAFLDALAENYGAGLRILDFINDPEPSRITINDWVSEQTEERIKDLIPPGGINSLTRLVLTNAIYFNAAWESKFTEEATKDLPFYPLDGESVTVPMMRQTESFGYAEGDDYQAVELPYDGEELSMVILLPSEGKFTEFEHILDYEQVDRIISKLEDKRVRLTMPKFEFESEFSLKQALSALGMAEAFSESADFSGMTGNKDIFIGSVIHKAFVLVEEGGTEAAAATAVVMVTSAPGPKPEEPVVVTIDRPFIFLIRDIETGAILFIGRVMNPAA